MLHAISRTCWPTTGSPHPAPRSSPDAYLENHAAAVALFVAHYNLCRVHEALRITPAMALGVTDHIWTIGELIGAASNSDGLPRRYRRFEVIDGGKGD